MVLNASDIYGIKKNVYDAQVQHNAIVGKLMAKRLKNPNVGFLAYVVLKRTRSGYQNYLMTTNPTKNNKLILVTKV